jgi:hypothetical protein
MREEDAMTRIMFSSLAAAVVLAMAAGGAVAADAAKGKRKVTGSAAAPNARSYVTGYYALDLDGVSQQRPAKRTFRSKGGTWQSNKGKQKSGWSGWSEFYRSF